MTKLVAANNSKSLRTTIPAYIIRELSLKAGDRLAWSLKPDGDRLKIDIKPMYGLQTDVVEDGDGRTS